MEALFGIVGKDFCLLAADQTAVRSIVVLKSTEDKSRALTDHCQLLYCGESGDTVQFAEYIQRNVQLHEMRTQRPLSVSECAHFTRSQLAESLRSRHPYNVNLLLGGFDKDTQQASLYWIDYIGAMQSLPFAAHGYAAHFCLSILDRHYRAGGSLEEAKGWLRLCLRELKTRFMVNLERFVVKVVDKDGSREISLDE